MASTGKDQLGNDGIVEKVPAGDDDAASNLIGAPEGDDDNNDNSGFSDNSWDSFSVSLPKTDKASTPESKANGAPVGTLVPRYGAVFGFGTNDDQSIQEEADNSNEIAGSNAEARSSPLGAPESVPLLGAVDAAAAAAEQQEAGPSQKSPKTEPDFSTGTGIENPQVDTKRQTAGTKDDLIILEDDDEDHSVLKTEEVIGLSDDDEEEEAKQDSGQEHQQIGEADVDIVNDNVDTQKDHQANLAVEEGFKLQDRALKASSGFKLADQTEPEKTAAVDETDLPVQTVAQSEAGDANKADVMDFGLNDSVGADIEVVATEATGNSIHKAGSSSVPASVHNADNEMSAGQEQDALNSGMLDLDGIQDEFLDSDTPDLDIEEIIGNQADPSDFVATESTQVDRFEMLLTDDEGESNVLQEEASSDGQHQVPETVPDDQNGASKSGFVEHSNAELTTEITEASGSSLQLEEADDSQKAAGISGSGLQEAQASGIPESGVVPDGSDISSAGQKQQEQDPTSSSELEQTGIKPSTQEVDPGLSVDHQDSAIQSIEVLGELVHELSPGAWNATVFEPEEPESSQSSISSYKTANQFQNPAQEPGEMESGNPAIGAEGVVVDRVDQDNEEARVAEFGFTPNPVAPQKPEIQAQAVSMEMFQNVTEQIQECQSEIAALKVEVARLHVPNALALPIFDIAGNMTVPDNSQSSGPRQPINKRTSQPIASTSGAASAPHKRPKIVPPESHPQTGANNQNAPSTSASPPFGVFHMSSRPLTRKVRLRKQVDYRPHLICATCRLAFNSQYNLERHELQHQLRKPFQCTWHGVEAAICGRFFACKGTAVRHVCEQHFGLPRNQSKDPLGRDPKEYVRLR